MKVTGKATALTCMDSNSPTNGGTTGMAMAVGDKAVTWAPSTTGESNTEYTIVAIYSDAAHEPCLGKHIYFFTLHNKQPKVLVTQQNQGNEHNWLQFYETQNQMLRDGFAKIVQVY